MSTIALQLEISAASGAKLPLLSKVTQEADSQRTAIFEFEFECEPGPLLA